MATVKILKLLRGIKTIPAILILLSLLPFTSILLFTIGSQKLLPNNQGANTNYMVLRRFQSYDELKNLLNREVAYPWFRFTATEFGLERKYMTIETASAGYSRTNIQVEGVDEADIVKTDGENIYLALGKRVLIIKAYPPEDARVSAEIQVDNMVSGLFINNGRLVIIFCRDVCYYAEISEDSSKREDKQIFIEPKISVLIRPETLILIYDVKNTEAPMLIRNVTLSGLYFNSRMIGDYVYVLASSPAVYIENYGVILPEIIDGERIIKVGPTSIYYSTAPDIYYAFTNIVAVNVQKPDEPISHETFLLGYASCIYVSLNNIYVAVPKYSESIPTTEVHRIRIEGGKIKYEASGAVPGFILNQFSMDEHSGYFRIATTKYYQVIRGLNDQETYQYQPSSNVYILDMNLAVVGEIEGLAPGEYIYSARFMGERCYLVTFKKVDPLFVISLEDPTNPKVLGKLKIPGYSNYLHPCDENYLIGIGKWTVEAEEGDFAWYQGLKISLFDVSDVECPKEVDSIIIGDRGTDSLVLHDHKALLFDRRLNLLAMPILVAEIDKTKHSNGVPPYTYGDYVWQGLYVFNITESSIILRGKITHIENPDDFLKSGYWFYSEYTIERALYIGDIIYTISSKMIKMNNLWSLAEINSVKLP
ncbi:MAG: beta-propeller domain-containing protein [Candidatus Bathyarchaeia archaeon]